MDHHPSDTHARMIDMYCIVELSHFTLLRSVGKGAFGKVRVVQHKGTKQLYALKYINKTKCIQMRAVENIISERRLLEQISCNLIVNMRYAFQDDDNLFMILDLMLGGDLRFHLDRLGVMPEEYVRFYAAEVAVSLHYLHSLNIIHRYCNNNVILVCTTKLKKKKTLIHSLTHTHIPQCQQQRSQTRQYSTRWTRTCASHWFQHCNHHQQRKATHISGRQFCLHCSWSIAEKRLSHISGLVVSGHRHLRTAVWKATFSRKIKRRATTCYSPRQCALSRKPQALASSNWFH